MKTYGFKVIVKLFLLSRIIFGVILSVVASRIGDNFLMTFGVAGTMLVVYAAVFAFSYKIQMDDGGMVETSFDGFKHYHKDLGWGEIRTVYLVKTGPFYSIIFEKNPSRNGKITLTVFHKNYKKAAKLAIHELKGLNTNIDHHLKYFLGMDN